MAINKVVYGNDTLIDLTEDTATADDVLNGKTFHLKNGVRATGNASIGIAMDLLWTNASPTSAFSPQTVNIDLSEYSMVYVTGSWTATDTNTWFGLLIKVGNSGIFSAIGTSKIYRGFHVSTSGINFEKGQFATSGGSSMTDNNLYAVPRQIYGVK